MNAKRAATVISVSKKRRSRFFEAAGFVSRPSGSRAVKSVSNENLTVFIRSEAHAVRAGFKGKGCGP